MGQRLLCTCNIYKGIMVPHKTPEARRAYDKARNQQPHRAAYKKRYFRQRLLAQYGLTPQEYDDLLRRQGGGCALCGGVDTGKSLAVDHNHKTGAVRGLLCLICNTNLGWVERVELRTLEGYLTHPDNPVSS